MSEHLSRTTLGTVVPHPPPPAARIPLPHRIRLRMTLLVINLDRLATVLFASAASFIGVDALLALLGVTASFPIAFPVVILGLATLAFVHLGVGRLRRLGRRRRG